MTLWGRWDDEFPPALLAELQVAYVRRKRFEARLQAVELLAAVSEALGTVPQAQQATGVLPGAGGGVVRGNSGKVYRQIAPEAALLLCR